MNTRPYARVPAWVSKLPRSFSPLFKQLLMASPFREQEEPAKFMPFVLLYFVLPFGPQAYRDL